MVALWIRIGTPLAGDTPLGVRLLGPLAAALGSCAAGARRDAAVSRPRAGRARGGAAERHAHARAPGAVTMTPDTPLLFFLTLGAVRAGAGPAATRAGGCWSGWLAGWRWTASTRRRCSAIGAALWLSGAPSPARLPLGRGSGPAAGWPCCCSRRCSSGTRRMAGRASPGRAAAPARGSRPSALRNLGELLAGQFALATPIVVRPVRRRAVGRRSAAPGGSRRGRCWRRSACRGCWSSPQHAFGRPGAGELAGGHATRRSRSRPRPRRPRSDGGGARPGSGSR